MSNRLPKLLKLLELDPNDAFVLYGIAQEHAKGPAAGSEGHERAVEFYDRCLGADPAYCYAYFHKAASLQALGRTGEARAALSAGIAAARAAGDAKALNEMSGMLASLSS